jgi:hypothetical protein
MWHPTANHSRNRRSTCYAFIGQPYGAAYGSLVPDFFFQRLSSGGSKSIYPIIFYEAQEG